MEYDLEAIAKADRTDVECVIPGSILMYLASVVKDKQIQMEKLRLLAEKVDADTDNLEKAIEANETTGCFLLNLIQDQFGQEFLDMFLGLDDIDDATGKTIN